MIIYKYQYRSDCGQEYINTHNLHLLLFGHKKGCKKCEMRKKEEDLPHLRLNPLPISMGGGAPRRAVKKPLPPESITESKETEASSFSQYCREHVERVMAPVDTDDISGLLRLPF